MRVLRRVAELREALGEERTRRRSIGFVPTMGYFHEGHLSLVRRARRECDVAVVSIFVNPTQFGPEEDYASYPRDIDRDLGLLKEIGVDHVFAPSAEEMYPEGFSVYVDVQGPLVEGLCAAGRPGHFRGVATVVTKLFNIVQPDKAYFGQKDAQQAIMIEQMVKDLDMPIEVVVCPTIREKDGLAMSSRNVYLEPEERQAALALSRALKQAEELVARGERNAEAIRGAVEAMIRQEPLAELEYVEVCDTMSLKPLVALGEEALVAVAARFGKARLIDNTTVKTKR